MFRRAVVGVGRAFRETGQAIERMGCRAQENWLFQEKFSRHRAVMNLYDQRPELTSSVFVAPSASVIGNVEVKDSTSIWCAPPLINPTEALRVTAPPAAALERAHVRAGTALSCGATSPARTLAACRLSATGPSCNQRPSTRLGSQRARTWATG